MRRCPLVGRHDKLAADFGDEDNAAAARTVIDRHLEQELGAVEKSAPTAAPAQAPR